jgi:hypothetical protein
MSIFSEKLKTVLKERNRFCSDKPFISPILLENENEFWVINNKKIKKKKI